MSSITQQPTVTADIVLLSTDQRVLLIKRRKWPFQDMWALPGGKLNPGESLETTALRELSEETGVQGIALTQFRMYSNPDRDPRGHFVSAVYVAHAVEPESLSIQVGDDAKEAQWFPLSALPPLAFDHAIILSDIVREQPHLTEQRYLQEILRTYAGSDEARDQFCLGGLGIAGETGEVIDIIKKHLYQGHPIDRAKMRDELGDVFWYYMLICHANGCSLKDIMHANIEKLHRRYPQGFAAERSLYREEHSLPMPIEREHEHEYEHEPEDEHPFARGPKGIEAHQ